jgi:hypothetical protein
MGRETPNMADRSWREEAAAYIRGAANCLVTYVEEDARRLDELDPFERAVLEVGGRHSFVAATERYLGKLDKAERAAESKAKPRERWPTYNIASTDPGGWAP